MIYKEKVTKILKSSLLLIALFGVWYGIYTASLIFRKMNTSVEAVEVENEVAELNVDMISDVVIEDLQAEEVKVVESDTSGSVEAASSTQTCESVLNELITTPVFIDGSGDVDFREGSPHDEYVSKEAEIIVTEVTVPAILLAGSSQVKDSALLISTESAALKAAGSLFDDDYARHLESPESAVEYDKDLAGTVYKEPFGSETEMAFEDGESTGGKGSVAKINVDADGKESICPTCQNANYNPDTSNLNAQELNETMSIPGGQTEAPSNEEEYLTVDSGILDEIPEAQIACKRSWTRGLATVIASISSSLFNKCNEKDEDGNLLYPDECIRVEDIVIRTNSFFGDYDSCNEEGVCTNTFMDRRILSTLSPTSASEFDSNFLVYTYGKVSIDGKEYTVKILWDYSYIYMEYYYQYMEKDPDDEFPSWETYWESVKEDYLVRS